MELSKEDIKLFDEFKHLLIFDNFYLFNLVYDKCFNHGILYEIGNEKTNIEWITKDKYIYMKRKIIINKLDI